MNNILCQINSKGFVRKPQTLQEYGKLRESIIQSGWQNLSEAEFVNKVTRQGYAFYSCLFNGRDLMELGQQRECWRMQTLIGMDFDHCPVAPEEMCAIYAERGFDPWLAYATFSDGSEITEGLRSYRLMWRVVPNLNATYEQVRSKIRELASFTSYADKHSQDPSRLWQGTRSGSIVWDHTAPFLAV